VKHNVDAVKGCQLYLGLLGEKLGYNM